MLGISFQQPWRSRKRAMRCAMVWVSWVSSSSVSGLTKRNTVGKSGLTQKLKLPLADSRIYSSPLSQVVIEVFFGRTCLRTTSIVLKTRLCYATAIDNKEPEYQDLLW